MIVQLKNELTESDIPVGLSRQRRYLVVEIEADDYRLVDDTNDPVLYENHVFDVVDPTIPSDWVIEHGESGEQYAGPGDMEQYVWEDYHDDVPEAVAAVKKYLARIGPWSWPREDEC